MEEYGDENGWALFQGEEQAGHAWVKRCWFIYGFLLHMYGLVMTLISRFMLSSLLQGCAELQAAAITLHTQQLAVGHDHTSCTTIHHPLHSPTQQLSCMCIRRAGLLVAA